MEIPYISSAIRYINGTNIPRTITSWVDQDGCNLILLEKIYNKLFEIIKSTSDILTDDEKELLIYAKRQELQDLLLITRAGILNQYTKYIRALSPEED